MTRLERVLVSAVAIAVGLLVFARSGQMPGSTLLLVTVLGIPVLVSLIDTVRRAPPADVTNTVPATKRLIIFAVLWSPIVVGALLYVFGAPAVDWWIYGGVFVVLMGFGLVRGRQVVEKYGLKRLATDSRR
jgi:membrane protein YdbS with pleckstrin-like domain